MHKQHAPLSWVVLAGVLALGLLLARTAGAEEWLDALDRSLALDRQGYSFRAIDQLEALGAAHPEAMRLRLELAALYLKTGQPERAETELDRVLDSEDLPVRVRINAQMLRLQAREAGEQQRASLRTSLAARGGWKADDGGYTQASGLARATTAPSVHNLGGRPVPLEAYAQLSGLARHWHDSGETPWLVDLEGGLHIQLADLGLTPAAGYRLGHDLDGPTLALDSRWAKGHWRLAQRNHWLWHEDGVNRRHQGRIARTLGEHWQLEGSLHYARETDAAEPDSDTAVWLEATGRWQHWQWQPRLGRSLDERRWTARQALQRRLGRSLRLEGFLGADDLNDLSRSWYSGVTLRWQP